MTLPEEPVSVYRCTFKSACNGEKHVYLCQSSKRIVFVGLERPHFNMQSKEKEAAQGRACNLRDRATPNQNYCTDKQELSQHVN